MSEIELAKCYQPLFDLMAIEHDKILTTSEMDEIIKASFKVYHNLELPIDEEI